MNQLDVLISENVKTMRGAPNFEYEAVLSLGSFQIKMMHVVSLSGKEDYVNSNFEERMITVTMLPSEYSRLMLYGHSDMTMRLTTIAPATKQRVAKTYRAVAANLRDPTLENNSAQYVTSDQDNITISFAHFQLIDPAAYDIRLRQCGGIFSSTKALDVIKIIFGQTKLIDKYNQNEAIGSLMIDSETISTTPSQIIVKDGTLIPKLPKYLQERYGVYSQGIACYLKNRTWYIFAPYTGKKVNADTSKMIIINVPSDRYRKLNATYKVDGKTVTILATGQTLHTDNTDADAMNSGTGIRQTDVSKLLYSEGAVDGTKIPQANPQEYMREYQSYAYNDKYINAPMDANPHTANPAIAASRLAAQNGCYMEVVWEHAVTEVLLPGMPVTFYTADNTKIKTMVGILVGAEWLSTGINPGLLETEHAIMLKLTLFLRDK